VDRLTPAEIGALAASAVALLSVAGLVFKLGALSTKVDTMWEFQMRRALSEGIQRGIVQVNSPAIVVPEALEWMQGMADELRQFYDSIGKRLTDTELAIEIERRFGERILHEVCIPNKLYQGVCLIIAAEVAKRSSQ
jgi:hypothetical protein